MLSALIPSVGRKPAVPLARQLAHESYVRPGPLVLGTAFLRFPAAAPDRDRHCCYLSTVDRGARSFLPGSACRHADRTISSPQRGARRMVSEDSGHRTDPVFPADCPHLSHCHCSTLKGSDRTYRGCPQTHGASSAGCTEFPAHSRVYRQRGWVPLSHDVLNPARVPL